MITNEDYPLNCCVIELTSQFDPLNILSMSLSIIGRSGQHIRMPFRSLVGGINGTRVLSSKTKMAERNQNWRKLKKGLYIQNCLKPIDFNKYEVQKPVCKDK